MSSIVMFAVASSEVVIVMVLSEATSESRLVKGRIVISYGIVVLGNGLPALRSAHDDVTVFHIPGGSIGGR